MPNIDSTIIKTFLDANGTAVSGDKIARELNITRVSIWSRLERLRTQGFGFAASTRVGYRMTKTPKKLHPALLNALLQRAGVTAPTTFFDTIDSTNSEAERQLESGATPPLVIAAAEQTAGRGRHGRTFYSRNRGNLYLSLAFRPLLSPERMQAFTLAMGVRLCHFLATELALPLQIKWPNDLFCNGRKIAGILTEARVDSDHVRDLVFGIGININIREKDFPKELHATAGSLAMALGKPLDLNGTSAKIIQALLDAYTKFIAEGKGADFPALWKKYDFLFGKKVSIAMFGNIINGTCQGIDDSGALILCDDAGVVKTLHAGEVTILKK